MNNPADPPADRPAGSDDAPEGYVWRIPAGQRLVFEDFDDGIVLFDTRVGGTHLLNVTSAESLSILASESGLTVDALRSRLVARLAIDGAELPLAAVQEMLVQLESLGLVAAGTR